MQRIIAELRITCLAGDVTDGRRWRRRRRRTLSLPRRTQEVHSGELRSLTVVVAVGSGDEHRTCCVRGMGALPRAFFWKLTSKSVYWGRLNEWKVKGGPFSLCNITVCAIHLHRNYHSRESCYTFCHLFCTNPANNQAHRGDEFSNLPLASPLTLTWIMCGWWSLTINHCADDSAADERASEVTRLQLAHS